MLESPDAFWFERSEPHDLPEDVTVTKMVPEHQHRHELQKDGMHPAPCARFCEATAFRIAERGYQRCIAEAKSERDKLRAFAQDVMEDWPDVGSLDGYDLQMLAVKHGLLAETTHHKPCCDEGCNCASMVDEQDWQEGVQCYRSTVLLKGGA